MIVYTGSSGHVDGYDSLAQGKDRIVNNLDPMPSSSTQGARAASLDELHLEQEEIAARDGEVWQCRGRKPDFYGGFIYESRLRDMYDEVTLHPDRASRRVNEAKKNREMYPGVEPRGFKALMLDPTVDKKELLELLDFLRPDDRNSVLKFYQSHIENRILLWKLGYWCERREDGVYLYLPDREALLARWEKLREIFPNLPCLKILSSQGIASDREFSIAYFIYDAILSTGKEFGHDHFYHIIPVISLMNQSGMGKNPIYREEKSRIVQTLGKPFRTIQIGKLALEGEALVINHPLRNLVEKNLEKIEAMMGAMIDAIASYSSYSQTQKVSEKKYTSISYTMQIWDLPSLKKYWERRFGQDIDRDAIETTWRVLKECERRFDKP